MHFIYVLRASRLALKLEQRALAVRVQFARSTNYDFGSFCIVFLRVAGDFFQRAYVFVDSCSFYLLRPSFLVFRLEQCVLALRAHFHSLGEIDSVRFVLLFCVLLVIFFSAHTCL